MTGLINPGKGSKDMGLSPLFSALLFLLGLTLTISFIACKGICGRFQNRLSMAIEEATLGMGCFWKPQKVLDETEGVLSTVVGYTGGTNEKPSYKTVCNGDGHREAIRVQFESDVITYEELLTKVMFAQSVDSFSVPLKEQYQQTIWPHNEEQAAIAAQVMRMESNLKKRVEVKEKGPFYMAEQYHQQYESKLLPRVVFLATGFAIDLLPGLPSVVYKAAAYATITFIVYILFEQYVVGSFRKPTVL